MTIPTKYLMISFLFFGATVSAQTDAYEPFGPKPEVGKPLPDFVLHNVTHFYKKDVTLADFRGKWLVLDFWASFCLPCVASFPKMSALQEKFKDKVQFMMIGIVGEKAHASLEATKKMYEKLMIKQNLNLSVAYDSLVNFRWNIWSVPTIIVVDDKGIVRISETQEINEDKIRALLNGKEINQNVNNFSEPFNIADLFDVNEKGQFTNKDLMLAVVIAKHRRERSLYSPLEFHNENGMCTFKVQAATLTILYRYAYFGKWNWDLPRDSLYTKVYPDPILHLRDSSLFDFRFGENKRGLYNYAITTDNCEEIDNEFLMKAMQGDLKRYFGYDVSIEQRQIACWTLIASSDSVKKKLMTRGGEPQYPATATVGFTVKNVPVSALISIISNFHVGKQPPFMDQTGIDTNIDITIDALMTDLNEVKRALRKNGLDLVKKKQIMTVMVISDSE